MNVMQNEPPRGLCAELRYPGQAGDWFDLAPRTLTLSEQGGSGRLPVERFCLHVRTSDNSWHDIGLAGLTDVQALPTVLRTSPYQHSYAVRASS